MEHEYVFGTLNGSEILRVKGPSHTDLSGFQQAAQESPDETVTDRFRVVRKLKSAEDAAGRCYDWYEIDRHYRTIDRSEPVAARVEAIEAAIERGLNL